MRRCPAALRRLRACADVNAERRMSSSSAGPHEEVRVALLPPLGVSNVAYLAGGHRAGQQPGGQSRAAARRGESTAARRRRRRGLFIALRNRAGVCY